MTTLPRVSVVIPCYNYGRYLSECVRSVVAQVNVAVDVLIIDDASPDGSGVIAAQICSLDERVRMVQHLVNRGHIATYNEGLEQVDGDYVVLLSADDLLTSGALSRAVDLMEACPSVGFVYGNPVLLRGLEVPSVRTRSRSWSVWGGHDWIARRCRSGHNCIYSPEVVMRGSVQRAIGGYRADLPHSGDMEMWLRAASIADVGRVNGADQAIYRHHEGSMQRTVHAGLMADLRGRRDAFDVALMSDIRPVSGAERLLATAHRRLAREALEHAARAYDEGTAQDEPVEEYVEFALQLDRKATQSRQWRALQQRRRPEWRGIRAVSQQRTANALRDVQGRIRRRRWRWSGV
jgi:hypothetical protein